MSVLVRDYTLKYVVDDSLARAGFAAVKQELAEVRRLANLSATGVNQLGQQVAQLPQTAGVASQGVVASARAMEKTFLGVNATLVASYGAMTALEVGVGILGDIGEKARNVRDGVKEMAEEMAGLRDRMRELANLQGHDSPNDQVTFGAVQFGLENGLTPDEARRFLEQYEGSAPAGRQKGNIGRVGASEEEITQVEQAIAKEGARLGQRINVSPATMGDLSGLLGQFGRIESGDDAARQLAQVSYGIEEGRGGSMEQLTRAFIRTAAALVDEDMGPIADVGEAAAVYGVMSLAMSPDRAATYTMKAYTQLRGFNDTQAAGLREMGIDEQTSGSRALELMHARLSEDEARGIAPDIALQRLGFNDVAGVRAMNQIHKNWDVLQARLKNKDQITTETAHARNEAFSRSRAGRKQALDAYAQASPLLLGRENEAAQQARAWATIRMRDERRLNGTEQIVADKIIDGFGILPMMGVPESLQQRINDEAIATLLQQAHSVGLGEEASTWRQKISSAYQQHGKVGAPGVIHDQVMPRMFEELADKVTERGGNPYGSMNSIKLKVRALARPEELKQRYEAAKGMQSAPNAGDAGAAGVGPQAGIIQGGPVIRQGGDFADKLDRLIDAVERQTAMMRDSQGNGFGEHPPIGTGYGPLRT